MYSIGFWFMWFLFTHELVSQNPLGYYIGEIGCNAYDMILNSDVGFIQSQSFFMALYRYLCIIHSEFFEAHNISGKVSHYSL